MKNIKNVVLFALVTLCSNCAHSSDAVVVGGVAGGVAGVGLNYLAIYGVTRAAFGSALAEHRELTASANSSQTEQLPSRSDRDSDGVPDAEDSCPNRPRGVDRSFSPTTRMLWTLGCPIPVEPQQQVTGGFSVSSSTDAGQPDPHN